jgi:hypothetical protein
MTRAVRESQQCCATLRVRFVSVKSAGMVISWKFLVPVHRVSMKFARKSEQDCMRCECLEDRGTER